LNILSIMFKEVVFTKFSSFGFEAYALLSSSRTESSGCLICVDGEIKSEVFLLLLKELSCCDFPYLSIIKKDLNILSS